MTHASLRSRARAARARIRAGTLRGPALRDLLLEIPFVDRDVFADELLGLDQPPPDTGLPRGAAPYVPSGVDEILAAVGEAPIGADDELVDLGAGLGRVAMLVHLLSGARARGIEIQAPLVARARATCDALALSGVSVVHADATRAELDGSVFYLYAPFTGAMLNEVCERLEQLARRRRIVVCAVGLELAHVPWLRARSTSSPALTIYEPRG